MLASVVAPALLLPIAIIVTFFVKRNVEASWENSHYSYALTSFLILFIGLMISQVLLVIMFLTDYMAGKSWDFEAFVIGQSIVLLLVVPITALLCIVRTLRSMRLATKHEPIRNPSSWLF